MRNSLAGVARPTRPSLLTALLLVPTFLAAQAYSGPAGSGTREDPYQVATLDDLAWISRTPASWDKHFVQTAEIDASATKAWDDGRGFRPIGSRDSSFLGTYNGKGHLIRGLTIRREAMSYVGLFGVLGLRSRVDSVLVEGNVVGETGCGLLAGVIQGYVTASRTSGSVYCRSAYAGGLVGAIESSGTVLSCQAMGSVFTQYDGGGLAGRNLGLIESCQASSQILGSGRIGGLAGSTGDGYEGGLITPSTIRSSSASGSATAVQGNAGGLVGLLHAGHVDNSFATGSAVAERNYAGGLAGNVMWSTITRSYATGSARSGFGAGGIAGLSSGATITSSYTTATATTDSSTAGGLVGEILGGTIRGCYAAGLVSGQTDLGGLFGEEFKATILSSFWDIEATGRSNDRGKMDSVHPIGAEGLSTDSMRQRSSYTGWNFDTLWTIEEGQGYPTLRSSPALSAVSTAPRLARPETLPPGLYVVAIHDIHGAIAWTGEARWTGARWNLPALGAGAWFLRVRTAQGWTSVRVVVR